MLLFIFSLQVFSTFFMTGVIWFVQIVHYPLFLFVSNNDRKNYCQAHVKRTTYIVLPVMLIEVLSAGILGFVFLPSLFWIANLLLLGLIWGCSFFIQVPKHYQLIKTPDPAIVSQLISSNWLRTIGWTVRSLMLFCYLLLNF